VGLITRKKSMNKNTIISRAAFLCLAVSACSSAGANEDPVGTAKQAQLDPNQKVQFVFDDGTALATVYTFSSYVDGYAPGSEYWYVNPAGVAELGQSALTVLSRPASIPPRGPIYANQQRFVLDENVSWGSGWTTDPLGGGNLYIGSSAAGNPIALRIYTDPSTGRVTNITWYQVLASGAPSNLTPRGAFSVADGSPNLPGSGSVDVPAGSSGYDVSQSTGW
jgi:hypothetical protein